MKAQVFEEFYTGEKEQNVKKNLIHGLKVLKRLSTMVPFETATGRNHIRKQWKKCHNNFPMQKQELPETIIKMCNCIGEYNLSH